MYTYTEFYSQAIYKYMQSYLNVVVHPLHCIKVIARQSIFHMKTTSLLLLLLSSLVEIHSQTAPYVSFMGEILPNYAYVDLSLVGEYLSGSDSVQCHTDLATCCSGGQGYHRGDWIPPGSEARLPFSRADGYDIYESRENQRVDLRRRNNADITSGIYRCDIPTIAVHDVDNTSVRDSVYVVLYTSRGRYINMCIKIIKLEWRE